MLNVSQPVMSPLPKGNLAVTGLQSAGQQVKKVDFPAPFGPIRQCNSPALNGQVEGAPPAARRSIWWSPSTCQNGFRHCAPFPPR